MIRKLTRIDTVRKIVDDMVKSLSDEETKRNAYVHLYGVGQACALIALHRGHDREYAELAEISGLLHDYCKYKYGIEENHAELSAKETKPLLVETKEFTESEIDLIYNAIMIHSEKEITNDEFSEILKDADEMQHTLRNPKEEYFYQKERMQRLLEEFSLK